MAKDEELISILWLKNVAHSSTIKLFFSILFNFNKQNEISPSECSLEIQWWCIATCREACGEFNHSVHAQQHAGSWINAACPVASACSPSPTINTVSSHHSRTCVYMSMGAIGGISTPALSLTWTHRLARAVRWCWAAIEARCSKKRLWTSSLLRWECF